METGFEYILELRTERHIYRIGRCLVGCDGMAYVKRAGVFMDIRRGRLCEQSVNKGGNTG